MDLPPAVFGHKSVFVATRVGGVLEHVAGEPVAGYPPAALTGQHWHWRAYGGPSAERRRKAAGLRSRPGVRPQPLDDPDGPQARAFDGVRSPEGWFLLTRDDEGWYVVAERRATPDTRSDREVYLELRRAAGYMQARAAAGR